MKDTGLEELSVQLWRQRELLEMLLFKLEEEQLLLAAGKTRWSVHATREIEVVVQRLTDSSLSTAVSISSLGVSWGLPSRALLRDLAEGAPPGMWKDILTEHLGALVDLIAEIRSLRASDDTWRADGSLDPTTQTARLIDAFL